MSCSTPYLFVFAQVHDEFRIPELLSVAELYGFTISFLKNPKDVDSSRPFMILELEEEEHAKLLARRCILIKSVYEFYARGSSYEELHAHNPSQKSRWERYAVDTSFKFLVSAYNHTIPKKRQREVVESFAYMDFMGKIDLKSPELTLGCFEEYPDRKGVLRDKREGDGEFIQVWFGRLVEEGSARSLIQTFDVKKRVYYGNTSMEAEISLLMANQTLASPGKTVYDPFVGTGSLAYTTAYFGALVFGSDIDGRQMRGKETRPGIMRAAAQYGVQSRIIDICTFDMTRHPWRRGELFDAIIADPPYGVRAGAKRLGLKKEGSMKDVRRVDDDRPYIPPTKPYELADLASDLVLLARYLLKPNGRLVFFLPTVTDEYQAVDMETLTCEGMEIIANSLQDFGSWGRRLITIRKIGTDQYLPPSFDPKLVVKQGDAHIPAHKEFRKKYFQGFRKDSPNP